ncbi:MAG: flagellar biosynthesis protein FliQ [Nitrospiria bacterium]
MTSEFVIEIVQRATETAILLSGPVLIFSLVTGLCVSLFQAVTQINEATLTFLPKILAVALALFLFLPWMMSMIIGFASNLFINIPMYVR